MRSGSGSMECYCYLRIVQDLLADVKTPHERRFGEPFEGPIFPFGATDEYQPISAGDQSRLHRFGKKSSPGIFLGKDGRIRNLSSKNQCERSVDVTKERRFLFSQLQMVEQKCWEETTNSETAL